MKPMFAALRKLILTRQVLGIMIVTCTIASALLEPFLLKMWVMFLNIAVKIPVAEWGASGWKCLVYLVGISAIAIQFRQHKQEFKEFRDSIPKS